MVLPMESIHYELGVFEENRIAIQCIIMCVACIVKKYVFWSYNNKECILEMF